MFSKKFSTIEGTSITGKNNNQDEKDPHAALRKSRDYCEKDQRETDIKWSHNYVGNITDFEVTFRIGEYKKS